MTFRHFFFDKKTNDRIQDEPLEKKSSTTLHFCFNSYCFCIELHKMVPNTKCFIFIECIIWPRIRDKEYTKFDSHRQVKTIDFFSHTYSVNRITATIRITHKVTFILNFIYAIRCIRLHTFCRIFLVIWNPIWNAFAMAWHGFCSAVYNLLSVIEWKLNGSSYFRTVARCWTIYIDL